MPDAATLPGIDRQHQLDLLAEIVALDPGAPERADGEIVLLRHDQLEPHPDNRPSGIDGDGLAELAASIHESGLLHPITVTRLQKTLAPSERGTWRIVDGERRWRAIGLLVEAGHWHEDHALRCITAPAGDAHHQALTRLVANLQREDLNPLDEIELVAAAVAEESITAADQGAARVAKALGKKLRWTQVRVQLARDLGADDKARLRSGAIGIREARRLVAKPSLSVRPEPARPSPSPAAQPVPAPVRETKLVRKVDLVDVVPVHADFVGNDPFPRVLALMDVRTGQTVDYVPDADSERRAADRKLLEQATVMLESVPLSGAAEPQKLLDLIAGCRRAVWGGDEHHPAAGDATPAAQGPDEGREAAPLTSSGGVAPVPPFQTSPTSAGCDPHPAAAEPGATSPATSFPPGDAVPPAIDLRGRLKATGKAAADLLGIPKFLRRAPDNSRAFPDAKPGDDP